MLSLNQCREPRFGYTSVGRIDAFMRQTRQFGACYKETAAKGLQGAASGGWCGKRFCICSHRCRHFSFWLSFKTAATSASKRLRSA